MSGPEIADMETEQEILITKLVSYITRRTGAALNPALTVGDDMEIIAAGCLASVLHRLRVLSARQLAVLLAAEANRHEGWVIEEPPDYMGATDRGLVT